MGARASRTRAARVQFVPPPGKPWKVATQLFPTDDPLVFTAPNLQYLMDSPTEVGTFTLRTFTVDDGKGAADASASRCTTTAATPTPTPSPATSRRSCARRSPIFGELPRFDAGTYTFLSDYLPWASGDGMEHRNSTVLSSPGALRNPAQRQGILGTVAHEFFHAWNMERIRSRAIEPFDFEDANVSSELWFGEGFTSYFDELIVHRAGLQSLDDLLDSYAGLINAVTLSPGRPLPLGRGDEPARAVRRRRRVDRPHGVEQHLHLLLHVGRRCSAWRSTCRCSRRRPARPAWTTTCG